MGLSPSIATGSRRGGCCQSSFGSWAATGVAASKTAKKAIRFKRFRIKMANLLGIKLLNIMQFPAWGTWKT
jgi:hypothetical protein